MSRLSPHARASLDARVLDWIAGFARGNVGYAGNAGGAGEDDARFDALALELFAYQYEHGEAYRRLCRSLGASPASVSHWSQIPAVPTGAFKEARLATFPPGETVRTFRSSGSTTGSRGELHLDTLALYDASLEASFGAWVCADVERIRFMVLAPSDADAPDSSLSYMFGRAVRRWGNERSRFYLRPDGWDPGELRDDLARLDEPVALVGTAFAFVHLLDAGARAKLPEGSRILETGGFKGRSREVERDALHAALARALGTSPARVVNQYGMCELGSQFYEATLACGVPSRTKRVPPWVRTRVVDPETLREVEAGRPGLLVHYDLANTGSVLAVQTSDLGVRTERGFEVLGRAPGAEARGCSIAADALLARA